MEYIEITEKSLEEAITKACIDLETTSDMLDYEVVEKSSGLLGIFNKSVKIKARKMTEEELAKKKADEEAAKKAEEEKKAAVEAAKKAEEEKKAATEAAKKEEVASSNNDASNSASEAKTAETSSEETKVKAPEKELTHEEIETRINTFLGDMFSAMGMEVTTEITYDTEEDCVDIELKGDNMGLLIGKRGQTLDSIQYLTSLVLNKGHNKYVRIKVDTENYRTRRKETLENLAKNIAYKVKRNRRPVSLEPMNPYERRIIHSALQNDKLVSTKSEGEEPFRHVVVFMDKEKSGYNNRRYNNR